MPKDSNRKYMKTIKIDFILFWFRARIKFVGFVYVNTFIRCTMETVVIKIRGEEQKRGAKYAQCAIYHNKKWRKKGFILIVHIIVVFLILRVLRKQSTKTQGIAYEKEITITKWNWICVNTRNTIEYNATIVKTMFCLEKISYCVFSKPVVSFYIPWAMSNDIQYGNMMPQYHWRNHTG